MLLAIDVGNTNMVFGIYRNEKLIGTFRLMTATNRTSDEIGLMVCEYFTRFHLNPDDVEAVIVASVVPQVMHTLTNAMVKYVGKKPIIVDDDISPCIKYEGDERLGADRAVSCDAAMEKYGAPLIVLDFGTATTVDTISEDGNYLGGSILAGMQISTEALFSKAAKLPRIELSMPPTVLGFNTVEQIQAGSVAGYLGAIEFLIRSSKKEMGYGEQVKVVATGGLARMLAQYTDVIDVVDNYLILDGLRILYDKNKGALSFC